MKGKAKKGSNGRTGNSGGKINPSSNALVYRGPAKLPRGFGQEDTMTTQINLAGDLSSSASGTLTTVFNTASQVTSSTDWTSFANLYTEWRMLSAQIEAVPYSKYNKPTTDALAPVWSVCTRETATALASITAASQFDSVELHEPSTRWVRTMKMIDAGEGSWVQTGTVPASDDVMYIKLYSAGNANSITLYSYIARYIIQFRGRQ
jgi:hypothetical protein